MRAYSLLGEIASKSMQSFIAANASLLAASTGQFTVRGAGAAAVLRGLGCPTGEARITRDSIAGALGLSKSSVWRGGLQPAGALAIATAWPSPWRTKYEPSPFRRSAPESLRLPLRRAAGCHRRDRGVSVAAEHIGGGSRVRFNANSYSAVTEALAGLR